MSLFGDYGVGTMVQWPISNREQGTTTVVPGLISGPSHLTTLDDGRAVEQTPVILLRETLGGETYLQPRVIGTRFLYNRTEEKPGLDDRSFAELSEILMAQDIEFAKRRALTQPAADSLDAIEDDEVAV